MATDPSPWGAFLPNLLGTFAGVLGGFATALAAQGVADSRRRKAQAAASQDALAELTAWIEQTRSTLSMVAEHAKDGRIVLEPIDDTRWSALAPNLTREALTAEERVQVGSFAHRLTVLKGIRDTLREYYLDLSGGEPNLATETTAKSLRSSMGRSAEELANNCEELYGLLHRAAERLN